MKSLKCLITASIIIVGCFNISGTKSIKAEEELMDEIVTVITIEEGETIPQSELKGTKLEGKEVKIVNEKLYVDGKPYGFGIAIFIAGIFASIFVDGVLIYNTGYGGGALCAQGIAYLKKWAVNYATAQAAYFASRNSTSISSYVSASGERCFKANGGNYFICDLPRSMRGN